MGNLYRFVEPVLLLLLKQNGPSCGYELAARLPTLALTDASIECAAPYRTLRQLETNGCVVSTWDVGVAGPARRVYRLTPRGEEHLREWIVVLGKMARSMRRFTRVAAACAPSRPQRTSNRRRASAPRKEKTAHG